LHNFNPRARKERDPKLGAEKKYFFGISIHAPVKSATLVDILHLRKQAISIHAPVKSATDE